MTTDVHDQPRTATAPSSPVGRSRPRWLVPGLLVLIAVAGLVLTGVISFSTAVSAGFIGGMLLMHLGGHGGHGAHGGGQPDSQKSVEETQGPR